MESIGDADAGKHETAQSVRARGKPFLIGCIVLLFFVITVWAFWKQTPEPVYQGKSVSQWFEKITCLQGAISHSEPAIQALVTIGEPAVPFLVHQYTLPYSHLRERLRLWAQKLPWFKQYRTTHWERTIKAFVVLQLMGPRAKAAIPELILQAENKESDHQADTVKLLGFIRSEPERVVPVLCRLLSERRVKVYAALSLAKFGRQGVAAAPQLREWLQASNDERSQVAAAVALLAMGESPAQAMPVAQELLDSSNKETKRLLMESLGELGSEAKGVVPLLQEALKNSDPSVRRAAGYWLKKIDPETATKAGVE